ncbi:MAG TPA: histone deacetylase [Clostridiaceae bacterium]
MILYDFNLSFKFSDFGIKISIMEDKLYKTIEYLKELPDFERNSINKVEPQLTKEDLLRVHSKGYVDKLFSQEVEKEIISVYELVDDKGNYHRYNPSEAKFPLKTIFQYELKKAAGSFQCTKITLEKGFCFYFGGGSHHAKEDYGEGFCILNDIVIAIRKLQWESMIEDAWVIDVDAHKGDGTASLTINDNSIKTLSIHMAKGWPLDGEEYINEKVNPSFLPSDIDIPINENEGYSYLVKLEEGLKKLEELSKPQLAIIVLGADPYENDGLLSTEKLKLTLKQMKERDVLIYTFLKEKNIPQAYFMAGRLWWRLLEGLCTVFGACIASKLKIM